MSREELYTKLRYIQDYLEDGSIGTAKLELEMLIQDIHINKA